MHGGVHISLLNSFYYYYYFIFDGVERTFCSCSNYHLGASRCCSHDMLLTQAGVLSPS